MVDAGQEQDSANAGIACWDGASAQSLMQALLSPAADCIESGVTAPGPARRNASCRRLGMTVTAQSVYRYPVAKVFARALQIRLDLSLEIHERVLTALQEAMINAMLHGNLGLDSGPRNDLEGLAASHCVIAARFASEYSARSLIRVQATWTRTRLRVVVRDSGDGFSRNELPSVDERLAAARPGSGRGLMILEALCDHIGIQRRGTVIALNFVLPGVET